MKFADHIQEAAIRLQKAADSHQFCPPVRDLITEIEDAYLVQRLISQERLKQGARLVGKKIGLTSEAVQLQLGVDQPDFGLLFDTMQIEDGGVISYGLLTQPKIEAEVALILNKDLKPGKVEPQDLIDAVGGVKAALEIVGSRIANWDIKITDTIADNASASHFVLASSEIPLAEFDLIDSRMQMYKNGQLVSEGRGQDCLGSPLKSAMWLAQTMNEFGNPLKKGDIILTGALGPMCPLDPGDQIKAQITGLGEVSVQITP